MRCSFTVKNSGELCQGVVSGYKTLARCSFTQVTSLSRILTKVLNIDAAINTCNSFGKDFRCSVAFGDPLRVVVGVVVVVVADDSSSGSSGSSGTSRTHGSSGSGSSGSGSG